MKKLFLLILIIIPTTINAACTYEQQADLREEASLIEISYEEMEREINSNEYIQTEGQLNNEGSDAPVIIIENYFDINILNLSEELYIEVTNDIDDSIITISKNNDDQIYQFEHNKLTNVYTYTFQIYGSENSSCEGEIFKVVYLKVPKLNEYYNYDACNIHKNEDVCQKYTTLENISIDKFYETINSININGDNTNIPEKHDELEKNNYIIYIIFGTGAILITIASIVIVKKKRT